MREWRVPVPAAGVDFQRRRHHGLVPLQAVSRFGAVSRGRSGPAPRPPAFSHTRLPRTSRSWTSRRPTTRRRAVVAGRHGAAPPVPLDGEAGVSSTA